MSDDREGDAIWNLLRERRRDDLDSAGDDRVNLRFRRESLVPVLDAALGVLAATRHLVEVTEEVLRQQRDRIAAAPEHDGPGPSGVAGTQTERKKIDLSY